ncbi:hypothetical protein QUF76_11660 [Desulfobacterales bacterium HSG16]|nr:hypothetical protein [Desulfobacterales bacterium HSG16]
MEQNSKNETKQDKSDPGWHRWFGSLFKEILTPLGLDVQTEMFVMTDPPRVDVVIIRKPVKEWTKEQLMFLPDGIRAAGQGMSSSNSNIPNLLIKIHSAKFWGTGFFINNIIS